MRQVRIQGEATAAGARSRAVVRRRAGRRLLVGPWLGEVGFELLYWIPFVRKLIADAGVPADRVLVLSRGGVEDWYGDAFGGYLDLYDLFDPDDLYARQRARMRISEKQMTITDLERDALTRAERHMGEKFAVLHPYLMFRRFRPVWMRRRTMSAVRRELAPEPIRPLARPERLPPRYVAVKLYSSRCFPLDEDAAEAVLDTVRRSTGDLPLVPLLAGAQVDDHADLIRPEGRPSASELASNLRTQTAIVQHADAMVSTYGGFAYLGALSGIPTFGLYQRANFNMLHLDVLSDAASRLAPSPEVALSLINIAHLRRAAGVLSADYSVSAKR
ncbi:hypothetical protein AYO39_01990 [Actinobacteria bacterium SCGC AG-212-D09]|nr:hypothetical protein AYO39_01990 [Actinobacteria bacterium SCGC AG-212-D09]